MIIQNDQYPLAVKVKFNGDYVDDTCDEMIIKLGDVVKKKSLGELEYVSENHAWLYPMSIDQTSQANTVMKIQAIFQKGNEYRGTAEAFIKVGKSILTKQEVINE